MNPTDPLALWDYSLPQDRIARHPTDQRDGSALLHLALHQPDALADRQFLDLPDLLAPGDLLVANDTRVMAARLRARRASGGAVELLLLAAEGRRVPALARPARRLREGEVLALEGGGAATIHKEGASDGEVWVDLEADAAEVMARTGEMPLPPYLGRPADEADAERYQTVYAGPLGAAAAPTAGLHFTREVLDHLEARGVGFATLTLHVGVGTFRTLRPEDLDRGHLHVEHFDLPEATAAAIARTRAHGGRVVAVGTTSTRVLEACTPPGRRVPEPRRGTTDLFIRPPYTFRCIDGLLTNFHLPRSSLLMLVAALAGRSRLLSAYAEAVARGYRFYSYGDAMLLL